MNDEANGEMDSETPDGTDTLLDLSSDLRSAVLWVKQRPIPQATMERAVGDALNLSARTKAANPERSRVPRFMPWLVAAAMCIMVATWLFRPTNVWAEVLQSTQKKPWIHGTIRGSDSAQVREFWISATRGQCAARSKDEIIVVDRELQIVERYDASAKSLVRLPINNGDLIQQEQFLELFDGVFRGEVKLRGPFSGLVLQGQKQKRIERDGKSWNELELQWSGSTEGKPNAQMTFLIDPQTHLPQSMAGRFGKDLIEFTFDYPENGPGDVYALGVPKDTKLVDRVPKGDMARILAGLKAGRNRFDDYQAMVIVSPSKELNFDKGTGFGTVFLVWKKGKKWRVEVGSSPLLQASAPAAGSARKEWVRDSFKKNTFETMNLCDGKAVYLGDMRNGENKRDRFDFVAPIEQSDRLFGQARNAMPENLCYPIWFPQPSSWSEEEIRTSPGEGPVNSILVTSRLKVPSTVDSGLNRFFRFWVEPAKGYAVVQNDILAADPAVKPPTNRDSAQVMDKWEQTPSGVWYAARVGSGPVKQGPNARWTWHHFFLDFKIDLGDDLFQPQKRTVFGDIYPVGPFGSDPGAK